MTTFANRMIGAAKLDVRIYEEVEADNRALGQAMAVVVLSSLAAGIGTLQHTGAGGLIIGTLTALIGWYVWAFITYFVGTRFLPEAETRATHGELLRTIGFSSAPGMIRVLALIPGLMWIVFTVAGIWMLIAMVIAVKQALDYKSTLRAIGVCLIGWVIQALIVVIFLAIFGGLGSNPAP